MKSSDDNDITIDGYLFPAGTRHRVEASNKHTQNIIMAHF